MRKRKVIEMWKERTRKGREDEFEKKEEREERERKTQREKER